MNHNKVTAISTLLISVLIISACSPTKIARVEKRKYQKGYYVQMKKGASNTDAAKTEVASAETRTEDARAVIPVNKRKHHEQVNDEVKEIKAAIRTFKKHQNLKEALASMDGLPELNPIIDTKKNQKSFSVQERKTDGILHSTDTQGGVIGVLLLLVGLAFLLVYLLAPALILIVVIAVSIIIGIVISVILKLLGIIGN